MSAHGGVAAPAPKIDVPKPRTEIFRRFVQGDLVELRVVLVLVVIWAVFQIQEPRFLTATNLTNLVLQITAIPDYAITDLGPIDCINLKVFDPVTAAF